MYLGSHFGIFQYRWEMWDSWLRDESYFILSSLNIFIEEFEREYKQLMKYEP